jgi:hypothetical protein
MNTQVPFAPDSLVIIEHNHRESEYMIFKGYSDKGLLVYSDANKTTHLINPQSSSFVEMRTLNDTEKRFYTRILEEVNEDVRSNT